MPPLHAAVAALAAVLFVAPVLAQTPPPAPSFSANACPVSHDKLLDALKRSVKASGGPSNGGFDNHMWASVVGRDGVVCAVAFSGAAPDDQWPGSRAISAEKANTANAFSLKSMALSTANLYAGAQPGGFLFGVVLADPVDPGVTGKGKPDQFGTTGDPMVGHHVGGVIVFGGGLALYNADGIVGGLGVSGDSSCGDHNVAWRVRKALGLDKVPGGVSPGKTDAIIYDLDGSGHSASGFGHPKCKGTEPLVAAEIGAGAAPQ